MFIMDVPSIPIQETPVMVADAATTQNSAQKYDRVIGVCHLSDGSTSDGAMEPSMEMHDYYRVKERLTIDGVVNSIVILQMPKHGKLEGPVDGNFSYIPVKDYLGNDRASLLVEVGGKKVRMEYFFRVMEHVPDQEGFDPYSNYCPNKTRVWKISSVLDSSGNRNFVALELGVTSTGKSVTLNTGIRN
jgi:hypothetical protein